MTALSPKTPDPQWQIYKIKIRSLTNNQRLGPFAKVKELMEKYHAQFYKEIELQSEEELNLYDSCDAIVS